MKTCKPNFLAIRTLRLRIAEYRNQLETCTTDAMRKCVEDAIADTYRQLLQLSTRR